MRKEITLLKWLIFITLIFKSGFAYSLEISKDKTIYYRTYQGASLLPQKHLRERVSIDENSSSIRNYISFLYDGEIGNIEKFTSTFLQFEGPKAIIKIDTRGIDTEKILVTSLETTNAQGKAEFYFKDENGNKRILDFSKKIIKNVNKAQLVGYVFNNDKAIDYYGTIYFKITNIKLGTPWIGEVMVNNPSEDFFPEKKSKTGEPITFDNWKITIGKDQFRKIKEEVEKNSDFGFKVRKLLGSPGRKLLTPKLLYLTVNRYTKYGVIYEYVIQVDDTGISNYIDYSKGLLYVPKKTEIKKYTDVKEIPDYLKLKFPESRNNNGLPLMVINHQTSNFAEEESVGIAGEVEQGICTDLVKAGVICLAPYIYTNTGHPDFFQAYPTWSMLGKILHNNKIAVDIVLKEKVSKFIGFSVDEDRIGAFGHSHGSYVSYFAPFIDERYDVVGFSGNEVFNNMFAHTYQNLIPLLSFYDGTDIPMPFKWCDLTKHLVNEVSLKETFAIMSDPPVAKEFTSCLNRNEKRKTYFRGDNRGHLVTFSKRFHVTKILLSVFGIRHAEIAKMGPIYEFGNNYYLQDYLRMDSSSRGQIMRAMEK